MPIATFVRLSQGWYMALMVDLPIFMGATFSIVYFYWTSQREIGRKWPEVVRLIPAVLALGIGISVNNARACLEALVGHESPFVRTPKYAILRNGESWTQKLYIRKGSVMPAIEFSLGAWFTVAIAAVFLSPEHAYYSLPFLVLFQFGFFYVASLSVVQRVQTRRRRLGSDT